MRLGRRKFIDVFRARYIDIRGCRDTAAFDTTLDSIASLWKQAQEAVIKRTVSLRYARNSTVPMSRLPVELLSRIFSFARGCQETLLAISCTCALWRKLILGDTFAWTELDLYAHPGDVSRLFVQRSANRPLTLRYCVPFSDPKDARKIPTERLCAYRLWRDNMRRVRRFFITIHPADDTDIPPVETWFAEHDAPILEELELKVLQTDSRPVEDNICPEICTDMPNLRSLTLHGVRLPWAPGLYPSLIMLHITLTGIDEPHVLDESLLAILRNQPSLEDLRLCIRYTVASGAPSNLVTLPSLKKLHLELPAEDMTDLLEGLSLEPDLPWMYLSTITPSLHPTLSHVYRPTGSASKTWPTSTSVGSTTRRTSCSSQSQAPQPRMVVRFIPLVYAQGIHS